MTVKQYCEKLPPLKISELIERIKKDNLQQHENLIIECMEYLNKIKIDHNADFDKPAIFHL